MKSFPLFICGLFAATLLPIASQAQNAAAESPLQSELKVFVVGTDAEGEETLVATESIEPGQTVEYQLTYSNVSEGALSRIRAIGPVPESTFYIGDSATEKASVLLEYSVDGGETFSVPPLQVTITDEETGETETIEARPEHYNQLRWTIPTLAPGQSIDLKYRVTVR